MNQITKRLESRQDVEDYSIGELIDLWYGRFKMGNVLLSVLSDVSFN